jgi:hypothetical protein
VWQLTRRSRVVAQLNASPFKGHVLVDATSQCSSCLLSCSFFSTLLLTAVVPTWVVLTAVRSKSERRRSWAALASNTIYHHMRCDRSGALLDTKHAPIPPNGGCLLSFACRMLTHGREALRHHGVRAISREMMQVVVRLLCPFVAPPRRRARFSHAFLGVWYEECAVK